MRDIVAWILELIEINQLWRFYKTPDWLSLRARVLSEFHNECQECLKHGRVTRAKFVHHINEVKHRPDLALCEFYTDRDGTVKRNLVPLCHECHDKAHGRFCGGEYRPQLNKERW